VSTPAERRLEPLLARLTAGPAYEVLALRYGTWLTTRAHCFLGYERYAEPDAPLRMDFFLWVLRGERRTIVIDTGFDPDVGARRGRTCLLSPTRALALAGVEPATVRQLVLTHLHYDHIGNLGAFPAAAIHVHGRELDFWSGPDAARDEFAGLVEPSELAALEAAERSGRVRRIEHDTELAPGVHALWTGGHTPGQLVVAVMGRASLVVLASDAMHFHEELDRGRPFALLSDLAEMHAGYELLRELAVRGARIVPGHDPAVMSAFPRLPGALTELGVTLG
jgi:glyoxylase-like metal-dependent hydrolase (beta-lactamase superfamily II)